MSDFDDRLQAVLDYARVSRWHTAGYDGSGITIASWEDTDSIHGHHVAEVVAMVAPGARLITRDRPGWYSVNGHIRRKDLARHRAFYESLASDGVNICTLSLNNAADDLERLQREILLPSGMVLFCAAGNEGESGLSRSGRREWWLSVGACRLDDGRAVLEDYSSVGPELDLAAFCPPPRSGTSFASPFAASMVAIWWGWYREAHGRDPSRAEVMEWLRDNCQDLGAGGKDARYGWGLLRLPREIPEATRVDAPEAPQDGSGGDSSLDVKEGLDMAFDIVVPATDAPIGRHFRLDEFACSGCGMVRINPGFISLVARLDALRHEAGTPCRITSGHRCPETNERVAGAARNSRHLSGDGADIVLEGLTVSGMATMAEKYFGDGGIGTYADGHIHVDLGEKRRWSG